MWVLNCREGKRRGAAALHMDGLRDAGTLRTFDNVRPFEPHPALRNPHLMTLAGTFNMRRYPRLPPGMPRAFRVDAETQVLAHCHWQAEPRQHPTLVLLHGLEGSVDSSYMLGTAEKAYAAGFNAVRLKRSHAIECTQSSPTRATHRLLAAPTKARDELGSAIRRRF